MKYLESFSEFKTIHQDRNFNLIFESLYEYHLSIEERLILDREFGMINESWFDELKDKSRRGALKFKTKAGEILSELVKKSKEILDFVNSLSDKISTHLNSICPILTSKFQNYTMRSVGFSDFMKVLTKTLGKIKPEKLLETKKNSFEFVKYIRDGEMTTNLKTRLTDFFTNVLRKGTNEGLTSLENDFLFENEKSERKSFLQRLSEKIMSFPPFSWLPSFEKIIISKYTKIVELIDGFFYWLDTGTAKLMKSKFTIAITFIFSLLYAYFKYRIIKDTFKFSTWLGTEIGTIIDNQLPKESINQSLESLGENSGFDFMSILNQVKEGAKNIPYIGDILSVIDTLLIGIGVYLSVKPVLDKIPFQEI